MIFENYIQLHLYAFVSCLNFGPKLFPRLSGARSSWKWHHLKILWVCLSRPHNVQWVSGLLCIGTLESWDHRCQNVLKDPSATILKEIMWRIRPSPATNWNLQLSKARSDQVCHDVSNVISFTSKPLGWAGLLLAWTTSPLAWINARS